MYKWERRTGVGEEENRMKSQNIHLYFHHYMNHYKLLQIMSHFEVFHMLAVRIIVLVTSFLDYIEIVFVI